VHLEFEGNGIYLSRNDLERHQSSNGLWVEFQGGIADKNCQDRYVLIEGTFTSRDRGHFGMWSGAINDITWCRPW
jgi:hypothetical protein